MVEGINSGTGRRVMKLLTGAMNELRKNILLSVINHNRELFTSHFQRCQIDCTALRTHRYTISIQARNKDLRLLALA